MLGLAVWGCGPAEPSPSTPQPDPPTASERLGSAAKPEPPAEDDLEPGDPEVRYRATVLLVPLRSFPEDLLDEVEAGLRAELDVDVVRHAVVELPESAYYPPRKRYKADALLDFLEQYAEPDTKVLGLTEVDISVASDPYPDWGIFGLGSVTGSTAVISSHRLKRKPKDRQHVRTRVATVAIHEIGHTFGLPHCDEKAVECVMLDAEGGIENTDTSSGTFGASCRALLDQLAPL